LKIDQHITDRRLIKKGLIENLISRLHFQIIKLSNSKINLTNTIKAASNNKAKS
jgi:hypothetical protein